MPTPNDTIAALGLTLPKVPKPVASYVNAVITGNQIHISGGLPADDSGNLITGKVPTICSVDTATDAARRIILNRLAVIQSELGDLNRVTRIISIAGFVNSEPHFTDHPIVINGASDLLVEIFGEAGKHARIALGAAALPLDAAVEISMIVEFE